MLPTTTVQSTLPGWYLVPPSSKRSRSARPQVWGLASSSPLRIRVPVSKGPAIRTVKVLLSPLLQERLDRQAEHERQRAQGAEQAQPRAAQDRQQAESRLARAIPHLHRLGQDVDAIAAALAVDLERVRGALSEYAPTSIRPVHRHIHRNRGLPDRNEQAVQEVLFLTRERCRFPGYEVPSAIDTIVCR